MENAWERRPFARCLRKSVSLQKKERKKERKKEKKKERKRKKERKNDFE